MAKKQRNYIKPSDFAYLAVGDTVRTWEHLRLPNGRVQVIKGQDVTIGAVNRLNGGIMVEDQLGSIIGSTFSTHQRLERI